jgi:small-conductance mechanosensitive channel
LDANPRTIGREQDASYVALEVELLRDALRREREATAREREIADQWRAQVEAANRQASEATAALREHLKLSAKALPSPDETSAHNAPQSAQTSETGKEARPLASAAQSGTRREARPLWKVLLGVR